ncbi:endonuclease domain-containing protein [Kitasatospora sp. NPDC087861]|uniref:endonuclease domain-containing protein n=1 Tax=unclassified Kitasatospora TaxID=2633591 RepID=UPI0024765C17|nr:endonuclease domain-containing protein [Kitasatospora sp. MAA19]
MTKPCLEGHATNRPTGPELARQDLRTGLYHLWDPRYGPRLGFCPRWNSPCRALMPDPWYRVPDTYLGPPAGAATVPPDQRCNTYGWPLYVERPIGPLPRQWPARGKIPRWYVWWRLYELQDGRCACCATSPATIDHDHRTGEVRGLLCISHNAQEYLYLNGQRACTHARPHCFEEYWNSSPARELHWTQVGQAYHHSADPRARSHSPAQP